MRAATSAGCSIGTKWVAPATTSTLALPNRPACSSRNGSRVGVGVLAAHHDRRAGHLSEALPRRVQGGRPVALGLHLGTALQHPLIGLLRNPPRR